MMKSSVLRPKKWQFIMYLLPGIIWYVFVVFIPVIGAAYYSTFEWMGGPNKKFIGFENYLTLFKDAEFWHSFRNNLFLCIVCLVGQIGIAFVLALLLNSKIVKFKKFHRIVTYFPVTLSAVVIGFIWSMIYDYNYGLLNTFLKVIGLGSLQQAWLTNRSLAMFLICLPLIWQYIGYYLVIILAGFSSIDPSILEVAEIDGANGLQRARYITVPLIKNTLIVCMTLCIAGNMKAFDHIYVMTGGGPGTTTNVMSLYAYQNSFLRYKMGYGSSISIGILVLSIGITMLCRKIAAGKKKGEDEA